MDVKAMGKKLSNWGKWGKDDERGTVNYITPERLARAARLVRQGKAMSLSIPLDANGPQSGAHGRINPIHTMSIDGDAGHNISEDVGYTDDFIFMPLQCGTQWDGLSHFYYDGLLYNGFPAKTVTVCGAQKCGIEKIPVIASRGVLADVPLHKGVDRLAGGYAITQQDLEETLKAEGVAIGPADILMIRTGLMGARYQDGTWSAYNGPQPGLSYTALPWLHERQVAAVASDNFMVEVMPPEAGTAPVHMVGIRDMGLMLGEYWDLEELARDCASDGVYECFLVAQPLRVTGGVGSPVNPIAFK